MRTITDNSITDTAERLIRAPAARIYRAFVDPTTLVQWLPPAGMTGKIALFEPRAGGRYRIILTYSAADAGAAKSTGDSDIVEGRFVDLVPDARIVQQAVFASDDPAFAGTMTIDWTLDAAPGGTQVTIRCTDVPAGIGANDHDAGLRSTLTNLAAFVE